MTDENVAWEQFQKADATNLEQASAAGMLQAIMAELSSVKADTARLAQKLPDAGADAGSDELAQEDAEMGGGMMPLVDGGAPPMGGDTETPPAEGSGDAGLDLAQQSPMGDDGAMPPAAPTMGNSAPGPDDLAPYFNSLNEEQALGADEGGEEEAKEDETLDALQDALARVKDPEAIAKLADIIKEYVMSNAGELEAEAHPEAAAGAGDIPPEALLAALAGGEGPALNGAGGMIPTMLAGAPEVGVQGLSAEPGVEDLPPELLEGLMKSDDGAKKVEEERDVVTTDGKIDATPGTTDIAASDTDDDECGNDGAPCVTITITIGELLESPMSKLFDANQCDGATPKDIDKDKKFESFEAACRTEPVKRSIDDLMNQNLRGRRGANGEFYKISKSATEIANERTLSVRKSLSSLNSVADMRVGDVLKSMWGLRQMGVGNLEKTYEPLIDEVVKYCDNHVGPQYTEPLFRSFGVDLSKIYDPLPTESFTRMVNVINNPAYNTKASAPPQFDKDRHNEVGKILTSLAGNLESDLNGKYKGRVTYDTNSQKYSKGNPSFGREGSEDNVDNPEWVGGQAGTDLDKIWLLNSLSQAYATKGNKGGVLTKNHPGFRLGDGTDDGNVASLRDMADTMGALSSYAAPLAYMYEHPEREYWGRLTGKSESMENQRDAQAKAEEFKEARGGLGGNYESSPFSTAFNKMFSYDWNSINGNANGGVVYGKVIPGAFSRFGYDGNKLKEKDINGDSNFEGAMLRDSEGNPIILNAIDEEGREAISKYMIEVLDENRMLKPGAGLNYYKGLRTTGDPNYTPLGVNIDQLIEGLYSTDEDIYNGAVNDLIRLFTGVESPTSDLVDLITGKTTYNNSEDPVLNGKYFAQFHDALKKASTGLYNQQNAASQQDAGTPSPQSGFTSLLGNNEFIPRGDIANLQGALNKEFNVDTVPGDLIKWIKRTLLPAIKDPKDNSLDYLKEALSKEEGIDFPQLAKLLHDNHPEVQKIYGVQP